MILKSGEEERWGEKILVLRKLGESDEGLKMIGAM